MVTTTIKKDIPGVFWVGDQWAIPERPDWIELLLKAGMSIKTFFKYNLVCFHIFIPATAPFSRRSKEAVREAAKKVIFSMAGPF